MVLFALYFCMHFRCTTSDLPAPYLVRLTAATLICSFRIQYGKGLFECNLFAFQLMVPNSQGKGITFLQHISCLHIHEAGSVPTLYTFLYAYKGGLA